MTRRNAHRKTGTWAILRYKRHFVDEEFVVEEFDCTGQKKVVQEAAGQIRAPAGGHTERAHKPNDITIGQLNWHRTLELRHWAALTETAHTNYATNSHSVEAHDVTNTPPHLSGAHMNDQTHRHAKIHIRRTSTIARRLCKNAKVSLRSSQHVQVSVRRCP